MEEAMGKGSSSSEDLVLQQVPEPQATVPVAPEFWSTVLGVYIAKWGPPTSSRAQGKVSAIQAAPTPPVEMDKELTWWLQEEEVTAEQA